MRVTQNWLSLLDTWLILLLFSPTRQQKPISRFYRRLTSSGIPRKLIFIHIAMNFNREWFENIPTSDFSLSVWISSQVLACHMSYVILTGITQTVLETSECFLSNTNNNMHILATETEELAVYSGHLSSKLLNSAPAAIRS